MNAAESLSLFATVVSAIAGVVTFVAGRIRANCERAIERVRLDYRAELDKRTEWERRTDEECARSADHRAAYYALAEYGHERRAGQVSTYRVDNSRAALERLNVVADQIAEAESARVRALKLPRPEPMSLPEHGPQRGRQ